MPKVKRCTRPASIGIGRYAGQGDGRPESQIARCAASRRAVRIRTPPRSRGEGFSFWRPERCAPSVNIYVSRRCRSLQNRILSDATIRLLWTSPRSPVRDHFRSKPCPTHNHAATSFCPRGASSPPPPRHTNCQRASFIEEQGLVTFASAAAQAQAQCQGSRIAARERPEAGRADREPGVRPPDEETIREAASCPRFGISRPVPRTSRSAAADSRVSDR